MKKKYFSLVMAKPQSGECDSGFRKKNLENQEVDARMLQLFSP